MDMADKIKVVASAIMNLSYNETMQIARSLADTVDEAEEHDPTDAHDVAELLGSWAENYMEGG